MFYIMERRGVKVGRKVNLGGVVLIFIGIFWLMSNFGIINWSLFDILFRLWPLILIAVGVNIIFRDREIVRYITWSVFFIIIIAFGFYNQTRLGNANLSRRDTNLRVEKRTETTNGKLNLQIGGGSLDIDSTDESIINADVPDKSIWQDVNFNNGNSRVDIDIKQKSNFMQFNRNISLDYSFSLNDELLWDIELDTGAINGTMDFSNLKVSELDIDMGASNLNLIFGDKAEKTNVDIDGGVTNLEITVPKELGVRIDVDGGIRNININDGSWRKIDGYYMSANYEEALKKLDIDVDMGIGKFDVNVR